MTTTSLSHSYRPAIAGWLALCRVDLIVAVDLPTGDRRIDPLWALVTSGGSAADLLDELTRGGISATPSFVLVDRTTRSKLRVLARGDARVQIGAAAVDGRQSSGWAEATGAAADAVVIELAADGTADLPITHGAVRVSRITTGTPTPQGTARRGAEADEHTAVEQPAPAEQTVSATTIVGLSDDPPPIVAPSAPAHPTPADESGYDHLFGETMYRSVEDAAVRTPDEPADDAPTSSADDRIDERTIVAADLAAARATRRAARRKPADEPPAPRLFVDLSTGTREPLDRPLVIGRAPSSERVSDGNVPRLVSMTTPNQDISRTHVQVAVEGGTVVVTDLHSRNGTMVVLPGKAPQQLRAGEPTPVTVGTVVDLGDGATLTVGEDS